MTCLVLHHPDCLLHAPPRPHPEKPERVEAVRRRLEEAELQDRLVHEEPEPAPEELLELVHPTRYLEQLRRASRDPGVWLDPDTYAVGGTWRAVTAAAGAARRAVDAVVRGNFPCAFALVRPPGHHAGPQKAMGFCLVNHAAVAVQYARVSLGVRRVMVVDWDVHHGNGTQEIFYRDGGVLFVSLHQEGWYPGTGALEEMGEGEGEGLTVNVPLPPGVGDGGYATVFEELLLPLGDAWKPELVVVSAGFDAHHADPLGRMQLSEAGFSRLTRMLREAAGRWCGGRLALVLEGGYDLKGLAASVEAVLRAACGLEVSSAHHKPPEVPYGVVRERVRQARRVLTQYWAV